MALKLIKTEQAALNIQINNRLLAKFIGVSVQSFDWDNSRLLVLTDSVGHFELNELEIYDPSGDWNQLMLIFKKMQQIGAGQGWTYQKYYNQFQVGFNMGDRQKSWQAAVDFCTWLYKHKPF